VKVGDAVRRGQRIGLIGATGRLEFYGTINLEQFVLLLVFFNRQVPAEYQEHH
jgi:hypothetical protein